MRLIHCLLLAISTSIGVASPNDAPPPKDAPSPKVVAEAIRLPLIEVEAPKPPPTSVTKLNSTQLYIIDSDVELRVLASPDGIVKIAFDAGPIKIRGVFVENTSGRMTTRTYKGPFVYTVEAAKNGDVELLLDRVDGKGKVIRRTLDVTVDVPPQPPPNPPGPNPPGPPSPPIKVTSFHVVMVYESGATLPATQSGVLYSQDIRSYLDSATNPDGNTKGWRMRDKDLSAENETEFQKALWESIRPAKLPDGKPDPSRVTVVPCWAIEVNGKVDIVPLPNSVAEGLALLKKYKAGEVK